jgi:hypothetical protein
MSPWLLVWIIASGFAIALICVFLAFLGYHAVQVARAARRFQEDVGGLAAEISRGSRRASERVSRLPAPGKGRSA